ncbi:hypothetical protein C8R44DRAFT_763543 [Mycena epipterygia]|nr:hypothetical protein C8R44DRAFT_763543 [Mycena epipterygia]
MTPRKKVAHPSRRRTSLRLKGNGAFLDLPLDILFEILKLLHPLDLLYLSRTNKALREFLFDRNNASTFWCASFESAEDSPPKCPPYTCEPQWARLLYEQVCHVCLSTLEHDFLSDPIWWEFSARYCDECCSDQLVQKLPKKLTNGDRDGFHWTAVFPYIAGSGYLAKDVNDFMVKFSALQTDADKKALIQERRDQTKIVTDYARVCKPWMAAIVAVRTDALRELKEVRWAAITTKLHEAGWQDSLINYSGIKYNSDLVKIQQPLTDAEWNRIEPKLVKELENGAKDSVMSERLTVLNWALSNLRELTKDLACPPRIADVALIPDVRAILEADIKTVIKKVDFETALLPRLPELLAAWSNAFEEKLREHTRAALNLPSGSDPFGHALAYFTCANKCCQGHFTGRCKPCPGVSYNPFNTPPERYSERAIKCYHRDPCTVHSMFNLNTARAVLEDVIKHYGKDPQSATCEEMDAAPGKLWCMRCTMANQPTGWRDAPAHSTKFHEKRASLRARWEVEIETEN